MTHYMLNTANFIRFGYLMLCLAFLSACISLSKKDASMESTIEAERQLTEQYGEEVSLLIIDFERKKGSLERHNNNDMLTKIATGPYFEYLAQLDSENEPYWLVTTSVDIEHIRLIDYSPNRIKAIACMIREIEERTPVTGEWIKSYPPNEICVLYVFSLVDETWKATAVFNTTDTETIDRDWAYAPDWLKGVIGKLPNDPSMLRERTQ